MSYTYLLAAAVESSEANSLVIAPLATLSANPTDAESCNSASKIAFSMTHQSIVGLSETLLTSVTLPLIRTWLTCLQPASLAHHSAWLESDLEKKTRGTDGQKPSTQSESFAPPAAGSKTCQVSSRILISKRYAGIFASLGIESVQPSLAGSTLGHHTSESGSGCWPTPTINGNYQTPKEGTTRGTGLITAIKTWPTPQCRDAQTVDKCRRGANSPGGTPLPVAVGGTLNPEWVEWLMGWPIGHTDLRPLAMDKYQQWLRQHGRS